MQDLLRSSFSATLYHYRGSPIVDQYGQPPLEYLRAVISSAPHPNVVQHMNYRHAPEPDDWAQDATRLRLPDGRVTTLHRLMANNLRSVVLILAGVHASSTDIERLKVIAALVNQEFGRLLEPNIAGYHALGRV